MSQPDTLSLKRVAALLLETVGEGGNAAVLFVLAHPDPARLGNRILVTEQGREGTLGDPAADAAGVDLATRALAGDPSLLPGTYCLPTEGGGEAEVFLELHHPPWELLIVGAGHVAQPLSTLGSILGLRVTVLDDRPRFATRERFPEAAVVRTVDFSDPFRGIPLHRWSHVVLVTRGHKYDYECLRQVLRREPLPGYIGMIGSRRRVRATFDALLEEGVGRETLARVHAPIGLDIGGETPAEIAVSVAAELVQHWRGGTGRSLREQEQVLMRFHPSPAPGEEAGAGQGEGGGPGGEQGRGQAKTGPGDIT